MDKKITDISPKALDTLVNYKWYGNVRELENAIYSAILLCESSVLDFSHFPVGIQSYFSHREEKVIPQTEKKDETMKGILKKVEREQIYVHFKTNSRQQKKALKFLTWRLRKRRNSSRIYPRSHIG
jgi:DNA-binding NtrC family response regulator